MARILTRLMLRRTREQRQRNGVDESRLEAHYFEQHLGPFWEQIRMRLKAEVEGYNRRAKAQGRGTIAISLEPDGGAFSASKEEPPAGSVTVGAGGSTGRGLYLAYYELGTRSERRSYPSGDEFTLQGTKDGIVVLRPGGLVPPDRLVMLILEPFFEMVT